MITIGNIDSPLITKVCGNETCNKTYEKLLKCSGCHLQKYCGIECQKADWPRHKKVCKIKPNSQIKTVTSITFIEKPMPIPGLRLIENFISEELHDRFITEMNKGSAEFNDGHYDGYDFEDYESFNKVFYELTKDVFSKLKTLNFFSTEKKPLKLACTLIGYKEDGFISRHVDSPLLSTGTVVIVSFNSPVVVNFYSENKEDEQQHKIFVPPRSMYSISGEAKNEWSHAILTHEDTYNSEKFNRGTRYAVLFTPPGPLYTGSELLNY